MDEGRGEEEGEASPRIVVGTYVGNGWGLVGGSAHSWRIEGNDRPEGYGPFDVGRGITAHVCIIPERRVVCQKKSGGNQDFG